MSDTKSPKSVLTLADPNGKRWLELRPLGEMWMIRADQAAGGRGQIAYFTADKDPVFDGLLEVLFRVVGRYTGERRFGRFDSSPYSRLAGEVLDAVASRATHAVAPWLAVAARARELRAHLDTYYVEATLAGSGIALGS